MSHHHVSVAVVMCECSCSSDAPCYFDPELLSSPPPNANYLSLDGVMQERAVAGIRLNIRLSSCSRTDSQPLEPQPPTPRRKMSANNSGQHLNGRRILLHDVLIVSSLSSGRPRWSTKYQVIHDKVVFQDAEVEVGWVGRYYLSRSLQAA